MIPNPWVILGAFLVAFSVYFYGHHKGWTERDVEMQMEIAKKNEEARTKEQELNQKLNDNAVALQEANNAIYQKKTDLNRLINASRVRINAPDCVQTSSSATTTNGSGNEAGSESDRQTLLAIAELVAQGDRNTAQLNACIDAYNEVRNTVNGHK